MEPRRRAQAAGLPGGVLAGREAQIGCEVAAGVEALDIPDEGDQGRRREDSDPWDRQEQLGLGHLLGELVSSSRTASALVSKAPISSSTVVSAGRRSRGIAPLSSAA